MYDTMQTQFKQLEAAVTDPEAQQEIKLMLASQQSERANFFQTFATLQNTNDYLELNKLKRSHSHTFLFPSPQRRADTHTHDTHTTYTTRTTGICERASWRGAHGSRRSPRSCPRRGRP
jgi:hypothetical protein